MRGVARLGTLVERLREAVVEAEVAVHQLEMSGEAGNDDMVEEAVTACLMVEWKARRLGKQCRAVAGGVQK